MRCSTRVSGIARRAMQTGTDIAPPPSPADAAGHASAASWAAWWRAGWSRLRRNRLAVFGLGVVVVFVVCGALAPLLTPYDPFELAGQRLSPPGFEHPFGTDHLGRDILSGILYGARTSLEVGFLSIALSLLLGLV